MLGSFKHMFPGETLKKQSSPIIKGDHPELNDSKFVSEEERQNTCPWLVHPNGLLHLEDSILLLLCLHYHHIE